MASLNEFLGHQIDALLPEIKSQFEELFSASPESRAILREQLAGRISSESKMLLNSEITFLKNECLKRPSFASAKKKNAFWERNLAQDILSRYNFSYSQKEIIAQQSSMRIPVVAASGVFVLGGTLALALDSAIIVPVAIVAAAVVFVYLKKYIENKNSQSRARIIDECLADLKRQLMEWLLAVEAYFKREVEKIENMEN